MGQLRAMRQSDLPRILEIQAQCYPPSMQEGAATILERLQAAGDTCLVAEDGGKVGAYLFAYRSTLGAVTPLGGVFKPCAAGDTIYLHDLALGRESKGKGLGSLLVRAALTQARERGLSHAALVAVQDAHAYWRRLGFRRVDHLDAAGLEAMRGYPGGPEYMVRALQTSK